MLKDGRSLFRTTRLERRFILIVSNFCKIIKIRSVCPAAKRFVKHGNIDGLSSPLRKKTH